MESINMICEASHSLHCYTIWGSSHACCPSFISLGASWCLSLMNLCITPSFIKALWARISFSLSLLCLTWKLSSSTPSHVILTYITFWFYWQWLSYFSFPDLMMNTFESYLKESIAFSITVRKCLTKQTKGRKTYLGSQI